MQMLNILSATDNNKLLKQKLIIHTTQKWVVAV